jgi:iron complex transport system substrate-binding protein
MYLVTQGGIRMTCGEREWAIEPGSLFWMSPGVEHDLVPLTNEKALTTYHLRVGTTIAGEPCRLADDVLHVVDARALRPLVENCYVGPVGAFAREQQQGLFLQLFSRMFEAAKFTAGKNALTEEQQIQLRRYCEVHRHRHLRPEELAHCLDLTPDYFARRFKAAFGVTPRVWLVQERIRAACVELCESSSSIGDVAKRLGYTDLYSFSRQFSKVVGCSASHFRSHHRAQG